MDDIAKLIAIVALISFAIDRIAAGTGYLIDAARFRNVEGKRAERLRRQGIRRTLLVALSGAICANIVIFSQIRVAASISPSFVWEPIDALLTWVVLFAGADRLRDITSWLRSGSSSADRKETPAVRLAIENDGQIRALPKAV